MADYGKVIEIAKNRLPGVRPSVYTNSQDTVCLRLVDSKGKSKTQVGDIKDELGVKDGVIRNSGNTPWSATARDRWADNAKILQRLYTTRNC